MVEKDSFMERMIERGNQVLKNMGIGVLREKIFKLNKENSSYITNKKIKVLTNHNLNIDINNFEKYEIKSDEIVLTAELKSKGTDILYTSNYQISKVRKYNNTWYLIPDEKIKNDNIDVLTKAHNIIVIGKIIEVYN